VVQQSESPLIHQTLIKDMHHAMKDAGFTQRKTLHFPQPVYPTGWWSCTMASTIDINDFRTPELNFSTNYYTHDIHSGARALPPYLQQQLDEI
jgi:spermidine synthase